MVNNLKKMVGYLRGLLLRGRINIKGLVCSHGPTIIYKSYGSIKIGDRTCLWPGVKLAVSGRNSESPAVLRIGERCSIGDRTQIHCGKNVTLGNRVLISWDVNIIENEYHGLGGTESEPRGINIDDEVWVGCRVVILNGVRIGRGATIGAGSVVTKDVQPFTLAAGNPARLIRQSDSWCGSRPK